MATQPRTSTTTTATGVTAETLAGIRKLFEQARALYAPEGEYMKGVETGLERGRGKAIAGGMQGLASAGLANTSMMGGLAKKYEEEVAAPTRASANLGRLAALSDILTSQAGAETSLAKRVTVSETPIQSAYGYDQPAYPRATMPQQTTAPLQTVATQPRQAEPALPTFPIRQPAPSSVGGFTVTGAYTPATPSKILSAGLGPVTTDYYNTQQNKVGKALAGEYFRYW